MSGSGGRAAGGMSGGAGKGGSTGGGTLGAACDMPRTPSSTGNSGNFNTPNAVCYFVDEMFNTWACSNIGTRTVKVNGMASMCGGALPAKMDGGYYFEFSAGTPDYTSFFWFTS